jgi:uncharacterized RDD family membrane protein YckC
VSPPSTSLAPGRVVAGYRIEGVAGRGGMGVVYRATQLALDRTVALKLIAPEIAGDEGFRERFKRESRIAASIEHPNVIPVHEAGEADGLLFISMRFVDGTDLRELIRGAGALAPARVAAIVGQVAQALDAAHERGLVHRDVKPGNVLIADRGGSEHVYLTDFGLTKRSASDSALTGTGQWVGTLDYVAPEQIEGRRVDGRTDVYALGCVLFEALTGGVPFERDTEVSKLWAHISEPPPSPSARRPGVAPAFDAVVARAMAKDPDGRFASAGDLAAAARAAASGQPALPDTGSTATTAAGAPRPAVAPSPVPAPPGVGPPWPVAAPAGAVAPAPVAAPAGAVPPAPVAAPPFAASSAPPPTAPPFAASSAPPPTAPPFRSPAPVAARPAWGRRMLGGLIDGGLVWTLALLVALPFDAISSDLAVVVWFFLAPPLVALVIEVPLMRRKGRRAGQTLGKMATGSRVEGKTGAPVTLGQAVRRECGMRFFVFGGLSIFLAGIPILVDALWPLWQRDGRALHDLAARTRVVSAG